MFYDSASTEPLIPWKVTYRHRWSRSLSLLRAESLRRSGVELANQDLLALQQYREQMARGKLVVHYESRSRQGFWLVPLREGVDLDLVRVPALAVCPVYSRWPGRNGGARAAWAVESVMGWRIHADPDASSSQFGRDLRSLERSFTILWRFGPFIDRDGEVYYDAVPTRLRQRLDVMLGC